MKANIEQQNVEILKILEQHPEGLNQSQIHDLLGIEISIKTLQRRINSLLNDNKLQKQGHQKSTRYFLTVPTKNIEGTIHTEKNSIKNSEHHIFTENALQNLHFLNTPLHARERVSYKRKLLDQYEPNRTMYIPQNVREKLLHEGKRFDKKLAAGTYAKQICQRLLIDLSYNSSRLEGNTYSQLDTQKLVERGITAEGKIHEETVMIMNHKEAILFLVENAQNIELTSLAIRNLHHLLSQDLLANPIACGNIRTIEVHIGQSAYQPLNNPHLLSELFELMLQKAKRIEDPFEQSFFLLVHLSYLQAFEDVNKRTSRLSCNIPFIKNNLCPLSFTDVTKEDYTAALITFYETNNINPLLELFSWAYLRSCQQYGIVKESLGEIDAYRIEFRQQRKIIMGQIIKNGLQGKSIEQAIEDFCQSQGIGLVEKFIAMTLVDLEQLHPGAIIGLGITEKEFEIWHINKKINNPRNKL